MKLSIWVLFDWLSDLKPVPSIVSGKSEIQAVLLDDGTRKNKHVILLKEQEQNDESSAGVVCQHDNDSLFIPSENIFSVFNRIQEAFIHYQTMYDRIIAMILDDCELQSVVDYVTTFFNEPIQVENASYHIQAMSSMFGPGSLDESWDDSIAMKSLTTERILEINDIVLAHLDHHRAYKLFVPQAFNYMSVIRDLMGENHVRIGRLVMIKRDLIVTEGLISLVDTLGDLLEFWIKRNQEICLEWDDASIFYELMTKETYHFSEILHRLQLIDWQEKDPKIVFKVCNVNKSTETLGHLCLKFNKQIRGSFAVQHDNAMVATVNLKLNPRQIFIPFFKTWLAENRTYCGSSYVFQDIALLKQHYYQASIAEQLGSDKAGTINRCEDYALAYAADIVHFHSAADLKHPGLAFLKEYDQNNNTEYYHTLFVYLRNERNQVRTAKDLFIHRNSCVYRLNKLHELLTDIDLDNSDTRQHLLLSFLLDKEKRG